MATVVVLDVGGPFTGVPRFKVDNVSGHTDLIEICLRVQTNEDGRTMDGR